MRILLSSWVALSSVLLAVALLAVEPWFTNSSGEHIAYMIGVAGYVFFSFYLALAYLLGLIRAN